MPTIPLEKFNINRFWEKTPTVLKYILVFAIFIVVSYFLFSKRMDDNHVNEIETMKVGIKATYELIENFDNFRLEQDKYNQEILEYLNNLHTLVEELNENTNRKLDMILNSGDANADQIIEKIMLLNESYEKLLKAYSTDVKTPGVSQAEFIPVDEHGNPIIIIKDSHGNKK